MSAHLQEAVGGALVQEWPGRLAWRPSGPQGYTKDVALHTDIYSTPSVQMPVRGARQGRRLTPAQSGEGWQR